MDYFKIVLFALSLLQFISLIISKDVQSWNFDGEECINGCERRGLDQYWCYTRKSGWRECFNGNAIPRGKSYISFKKNTNSSYQMIIKTDPEYENLCVTDDPFCLNCSDNGKKRGNGDCLSNDITMEHYFKYLSSLSGCEHSEMLVINPRTFLTKDTAKSVFFRHMIWLKVQ